MKDSFDESSEYSYESIPEEKMIMNLTFQITIGLKQKLGLRSTA